MLRIHRHCMHLTLIVIAFCEMPASTAAQSGEALWTFDVSNVSGAFVSVDSDGTIYTTDQDRLWAIHPSGAVKWTFEEAAGAGGIPAGSGAKPVDFLPDNRLVVAAGHTIWALEKDGTVSWSYTWGGGYNNQIDNGPSVGPDGNIYATTAVNDGKGLGVFSLTPDGQLRWKSDGNPPLLILNASHGQRVRFTDSRLVFGFIATTGSPTIYAYGFDGKQTNLIGACTSSPKTNGVDRLLTAGVCGVRSTNLASSSVEWTVSLGAVNMLPIAGVNGVVYSGRWHGSASAISPQGQVLWTSPDVGLQRTLAVSDQHGLFLYAGETFGQPNWFGAIDTATGQSLWQLPFASVGTHNELSWSNEAVFSPDGNVAYFTTRFTSNGAPGRLWAVRIAEGGVYCTPKVNSCGTLPYIGSTGAPSSSSSSGFTVSATDTRALKAGLLLYTDSGPGNTPFSGGVLCINTAPLKRSVAVVDTSGTAGQCNGTLSIDMNAFAVGALGGNPLPSLTVPGTQVNCQFWGRDTLANGALLSDALEYFVGS